jgi:hypothetical protein
MDHAQPPHKQDKLRIPMNTTDEKHEARKTKDDDASKWKFRIADRLLVERLLPIMDGNSLKMLFLFDCVQKSQKVRFWYLIDADIAKATGMRYEQVARARRKLAELDLIDFRLYRTGAYYRWHRLSKADKRVISGGIND